MTTDVTTQSTVCGSPRNGDKTKPCVLAPNHTDEHQGADGVRWHNCGPLLQYEITWMSGHVETIPAHQVTYPHRGFAFSGDVTVGLRADGGAPRVQLHAEIDGVWQLMLSAREEDIRTMRNVTGGERLP